MEEKNISIFDMVGGNAAVSTEDGDNLFKEITKFLGRKVIVKLDFLNIDTITSTFLNAAIGQLYSKYKGDYLRQYLKVLNLESIDRDLLIRVIERAKEYFKDKEKLDRAIEESLDE